MKRLLAIMIMLAILAGIPAISAVDVVTTTSVLWDPVTQIGGDSIHAIYIADPTICPHLQGDVLPGLIQKNADILGEATVFLAHNSTMDTAAMQAIEKFRDANGYGKTTWKILPADAAWNTPESAMELADTVTGWLKQIDPQNAEEITKNAEAYKEKIQQAGVLTDDEISELSKKSAIVMAWQREPVEDWLGMNVYDFFAPEFAFGGNKTPAKVVDSIKGAPEGIYALDLVSGGGKMYIIENMQSGEMAKGIEEALGDVGVLSKRVVFTNFPLSVEGVESIPDVLAYNKGLILS